MTDPIRTKPNDGSEITKNGNDRMVVAPEYQRFFDDLEEENNKNVSSIKTAIYDVTALPLPQENRGGIILVTGILSFGRIPVPCWAANAEPPLTFLTITSVTEAGGGIAQFNFTGGPVPTISQRVTISDFVDNPLYNVTETKVTSSGPGNFQISSILFGTNEINIGKFTLGANWRELITAQIVG